MLAVVEDQVPQVLLFQFFIGDAPWGTVASTASASSTCFNSLLEMRPKLKTKWPPGGRPFSILYWRCPVRCQEVQQVSASDLGFNSLLEMRLRQGMDPTGVPLLVSILYWRCNLIMASRASDLLPPKSFNSLLEMRNAVRSGVPAEGVRREGFNSLLEMRSCSAKGTSP